jgi:diacylglycerol kinase
MNVPVYSKNKKQSLLFFWLTELAFLTPSSIFINIEIINTKIESATGTMFRQAHDTYSMVHTNKKDMKVSESIIGIILFFTEALILF